MKRLMIAGLVLILSLTVAFGQQRFGVYTTLDLSLIHISEPTRLLSISYAVFCLKKKKQKERNQENQPLRYHTPHY